MLKSAKLVVIFQLTLDYKDATTTFRFLVSKSNLASFCGITKMPESTLILSLSSFDRCVSETMYVNFPRLKHLYANWGKLKVKSVRRIGESCKKYCKNKAFARTVT